MNVLLVRPHLILALSRRFNSFLHLEPLDLEIVAGGVPPPHRVEILDLSHGARPFAVLRRKLASFRPDVVGFGCYSNQASAVRELAQAVRHALPAATDSWPRKSASKAGASAGRWNTATIVWAPTAGFRPAS